MNESVYPPSEDTYLLLRAALKEVQGGERVLEVGAGSGVVAKELSKIADFVLATELNPHAAKLCSEKGLEVILTNLTRGIKGKFDLIVFNPPYLPGEPEDLESLAWCGGEGGTEVAKRFLVESTRVLKEGGRVILILSTLGDVEGFIKFAESMGFIVEIVDKERLFFERLYALRLRRKNI